MSSWASVIEGTPYCRDRDRKSTRLNSSHLVISYAVFCLKKKLSTVTHVTTHMHLAVLTAFTSAALTAYGGGQCACISPSAFPPAEIFDVPPVSRLVSVRTRSVCVECERRR